MKPPQHLFVYGTLHPDRAPAEIAHAVRHLRELSPGTLRGTRYDLGDYPGVVIHPDRPNDIVQGTVFALPDDPAILQALDRYEDYRPNDPTASLFLRATHPVTMADGTTLDCWVYLYNQTVGAIQAAVSRV
jgi:gamma-glutamylcyclotransferase (GGCT)/AIG2-like uncharacterized protein YtfP